MALTQAAEAQQARDAAAAAEAAAQVESLTTAFRLLSTPFSASAPSASADDLSPAPAASSRVDEEPSPAPSGEEGESSSAAAAAGSSPLVDFAKSPPLCAGASNPSPLSEAETLLSPEAAEAEARCGEGEGGGGEEPPSSGASKAFPSERRSLYSPPYSEYKPPSPQLSREEGEAALRQLLREDFDEPQLEKLRTELQWLQRREASVRRGPLRPLAPH